jgi:diguanylate cyclase (GGDEF)-like protein
MTRADRLLRAISEFPFEHREHQPLGFVSVSIGIACFPDHAHDKPALIAAADSMVYQAKKQGRNRLCVP